MRGFYESLSRSFQGEGVTRIAHYGDSHVAADILTGALRQELQLWFGDGGAGLVMPGLPWPPAYRRAGVAIQATSGWHVEGLTQASTVADGRLGFAGLALSARTQNESVTVKATGSYFDIYAMKQPGGGSISVWLDGVVKKRNISLVAAAGEFICIEVVAEAGSLHTLELTTTSAGHTRIFGIAIERNSPGVVYDALGINGARATRPLRWDWNLLRASLARRDPDLIVVAYGSNEVGDSDLDLNEYQASFTALLERFHQAAPRASLLVIGPPDREWRTRLGWRTIPRLHGLVEAQRRAAFEAGAAFYDLFRAMGGEGSIERWARQPPPLAQADRVHLTSGGYKLVGDWLFSELMNGYLKSVSEVRSPNSQ
jgi:lysophospholipase L1-like esterase